MLHIALIGPPGAGKGTHAPALCRTFGMRHVSTGNLLRENLQNETALGLLARKYMEQGELVPDEIVDAMIEECLRKTPPQQGILFDGFPRTQYQAQFLEKISTEVSRPLDAVVYLHIREAESRKRLRGRIICRRCQAPFNERTNVFQACPFGSCRGEHLYKCREDEPEVIAVRLHAFHRKTMRLAERYQAEGKLAIAQGEGEISQVGAALAETFTCLRQNELCFADKAALAKIRLRKTGPTRPPAAPQSSPELNILLMGSPGSGKGTQAARLSQKLGIVHIATGDLFRENLRRETRLGKLAKGYMERGELVPDNVTEAMLRERLEMPDVAAGFILDGFPRSLAQAEALAEMLAEHNRELHAAFFINVADEEIVRRLAGRLICRECQAPFHREFNPFKICPKGICRGEFLYQRSDDNPETVRARLRIFHAKTRPVIAFYRQAGLLVEISGEQSVEEVNGRLLQRIHGLMDPALRRKALGGTA